MQRITERILFGFVFVLLIPSCTKPVCLGTNQYNLLIEYYNTLESNYNGQGALIGKNLLANLVLSDLTEIASKASYGDITVYSKSSDFKFDMRKWKEWITDKSCNADLRMMKRKEQEILSNNNWLEK